METKAKIPFQKILTSVKALTPLQKAKLRKALVEPASVKEASFTDLLRKGPVYTEEQIQFILENRKSISQWRMKN